MSDRPDKPLEEELHGPRLFERRLSELFKRAVESGVEKIAEGPESIRQLVAELKVPKEIASYLFVQIDETKNGLYRVVAKEIRDFLEHTNVADEVTRALTKLSFEVKTEIRFIPNDASPGEGKTPKPEVRSTVHVHREPKSDRTPSKPRD